MEEKEISVSGKQQPQEDFWNKISGYVVAFLFGAFTTFVILYWMFSPMFMEIGNHGAK
ncbi:MAG TPA: hypothetical protein PKI94_07685 [Candidatus Gastranaerophilaceae bacterium]|nr:hypothetical protein [Candidatus Gastranaerophilaceae bacterium]